MLDPKELKKPPHMSDSMWRQRLQWLEVVGKQLDENIAKRRQQLQREAASGEKAKPS